MGWVNSSGGKMTGMSGRILTGMELMDWNNKQKSGGWGGFGGAVGAGLNSMFGGAKGGGGVGGATGGAGFTPAPDRRQEQKLAKLAQDQTAAYQAETKARYEKLMGMAQQFGAAQQAQSNQLLMQQQAAGQQSLVSRGLGNSTVVDSVNQGAQDLHQRRMLDIGERTNAIQMGVVQDHVPEAPNLGLIAQLMQNPRAGSDPLISSLAPFNLFSQPTTTDAAAGGGGRKKKKGK